MLSTVYKQSLTVICNPFLKSFYKYIELNIMKIGRINIFYVKPGAALEGL